MRPIWTIEATGTKAVLRQKLCDGLEHLAASYDRMRSKSMADSVRAELSFVRGYLDALVCDPDLVFRSKITGPDGYGSSCAITTTPVIEHTTGEPP